MKGPDTFLDGFPGGPMLLVFFHEPPHGCRVQGAAKDVVGKLGGIDPLELLAAPHVDTHDLVEGHPMSRLPLFHAGLGHSYAETRCGM